MTNFCGKCCLALKCEKVGIVGALHLVDGSIYRLYAGDIYSCPQCSHRTLIFNSSPMMEHFNSGFAGAVELATREKKLIKIWDTPTAKRDCLAAQYNEIVETHNLQPWDDLDTNGRQNV